MHVPCQTGAGVSGTAIIADFLGEKRISFFLATQTPSVVVERIAPVTWSDSLHFLPPRGGRWCESLHLLERIA
ncbi:hypothetical protein EBU58_07170, partial [bacterium]|nr:hypothetical protein [bacterium]